VLQIPGPHGPISYERDSLGYPRVYARGREEAAFAQGWLHAEEPDGTGLPPSRDCAGQAHAARRRTSDLQDESTVPSGGSIWNVTRPSKQPRRPLALRWSSTLIVPDGTRERSRVGSLGS
jgi:hypothetical protein